MEIKGPRRVWRRLKLENLHHLTSIHTANLQLSKDCSTQIRINKYTNRAEYREEKQTQAYRLIWFSAKKTKTLEKWTIFSSNGTKTTWYLVGVVVEIKRDPYLTPYTNIILRWTIHQNVKAQTMKFSGGNIGG